MLFTWSNKISGCNPCKNGPLAYPPQHIQKKLLSTQKKITFLLKSQQIKYQWCPWVAKPKYPIMWFTDLSFQVHSVMSLPSFLFFPFFFPHIFLVSSENYLILFTVNHPVLLTHSLLQLKNTEKSRACAAQTQQKPFPWKLGEREWWIESIHGSPATV